MDRTCTRSKPRQAEKPRPARSAERTRETTGEKNGSLWTFLNIDAAKGVRSLDENSVDCVVTSPPYYWQRDYGVNPYRLPEAYQGSVARTMFDAPSAEDDSVVVLISEENIASVTRGSMVRIGSYNRKSGKVEANYVGQIISGPFAIPDAMRHDSAQLVLPAVNNATLTPRFHGMALVEIFGVEEEAQILPPLRRPIPNSPVFLLESDRIKSIIGVDVPEAEKPFTLGLLDGAHDVEIKVPTLRKSVLPKHTAILGTTGAGKSTTVAGMATKIGQRGHPNLYRRLDRYLKEMGAAEPPKK